MDHTTQSLDYKRLARTSQEIRLLHILLNRDEEMLQMQFETYALDETPRYHALSYEWGRTGHDVAVIVDGVKVCIRENAGAFLSSMRLIYGEILVWMDCLCINQCDSSEKNHQVELMGEIYRRAAVVHAWVGPSTWSSQLFFDTALEHRSRKPNRRYYPWGDMHLHPREYWARYAACRIRPAMRDLLSRSYWTRLWVLQEMILAKEIVFVCGSDILSIADLILMCEMFEASSSYTDDAVFSYGCTVLDKVEMFRKEGRSGNHWTSVFRAFSRNMCSDPRDKVYGFRHMLANPNGLEVDYSKPVLDVYMDLLRMGLMSESYEGLEHARRLLHDMQESVASFTQAAKSAPVDTDLAPIWVARSYRVTAYAGLSSCSEVYKLQISFPGLNIPALFCSMNGSASTSGIAIDDIICYFGSKSGFAHGNAILVLREVSPDKFICVARVRQLMKYLDAERFHFIGSRCFVTIGSLGEKVIQINRLLLSNILPELEWMYPSELVPTRDM